jgi:broad specificity phosphatase PhoE
MNLYFIRHGETEYNALNISQGEDTELSSLGLTQAELLAKRFSNTPVDVIYSSPMKRARQTAEVVSKLLEKDITYSDYLKEQRAPSEFVGKRKDSLELVEIEKLRDFNEKDFLWHYSDEENFNDFKERVRRFFDTLSETKQENVLIVSHGGPIRLLIFLMMEERVDPRAFYRFADLFRVDNAGITFCKKNKKEKYSVQFFNDCSHLK